MQDNLFIAGSLSAPAATGIWLLRALLGWTQKQQAACHAGASAIDASGSRSEQRRLLNK
jgi:hypothetical protein